MNNILINDLKPAFKALMLFRRYTGLPRWIEIGGGIQAWTCIGLFIYGVFG